MQVYAFRHIVYSKENTLFPHTELTMELNLIWSKCDKMKV